MSRNYKNTHMNYRVNVLLKLHTFISSIVEVYFHFTIVVVWIKTFSIKGATALYKPVGGAQGQAFV